MVKIMDIPDPRGRGSFWEAYRACAEENRVRPDRSPFYVNWVKDFANFLPQKPLTDRSRKDIEAFLADLGKRRGIADWQVRQGLVHFQIADDVLFFLFCQSRHECPLWFSASPSRDHNMENSF